jgi:hypothetical protein
MSPEASGPPMESSPPAESQPPVVMCATHQVRLEPGKVEVTYQGHTFPVEALCCPICGQALIPEELAKGRMLEVERTLEEK